MESAKNRSIHAVQIAQKQQFKKSLAVSNKQNSFNRYNNNGGRANYNNFNKNVNKNKPNNSNKPQFVRKADTNITCFKCRKTGHTATTCRSQPTQNIKQEKIFTAQESELDMLKIEWSNSKTYQKFY